MKNTDILNSQHVGLCSSCAITPFLPHQALNNALKKSGQYSLHGKATKTGYFQPDAYYIYTQYINYNPHIVKFTLTLKQSHLAG